MSEYTTLESSEIKFVVEQLIDSSEGELLPNTFSCDFKTEISPSNMIADVFEEDTSYDVIGFPVALSDDEYYKVNAVLNPGTVNSSSLTFEVCSEWMRIYIDETASPDQYNSFFSKFSGDYPFTITVAEEYIS